MKKTIRTLFAAFLAISMCVCAFALTLDTAENITDSEGELHGTLAAGESDTFDPVKGDLVYMLQTISDFLSTVSWFVLSVHQLK